MRIRKFWIMRCLLLFCLLLVVGCEDGSISLPASKVEQRKLIHELEMQAGFVLPGDTELLDITNGGARDPSYLSWGLYSPSRITTMPPDDTPSYIDGYLYLPLATAELNEESLGNVKIKQPQSVFCSDWKANGYQFYGTVIRTPQGDYMVIERFR